MRRDNMEPPAQWPSQCLPLGEDEPLKSSSKSNSTFSGASMQSTQIYAPFGHGDYQHHGHQLYQSSETDLSSSNQSLQSSPTASIALSATTFSTDGSPHSYLGANDSTTISWEQTHPPLDSYNTRYDHLYQFFAPDKALNKPQIDFTATPTHHLTTPSADETSTCSSCHDNIDSNPCLPDVCGTALPPCEDPTCEDVLPCSEAVGPCIPDQCWGVVCTDESCAPQTLDESNWCSQPCLESTCVTPDCGEQCLTTPACDESCSTLPCCPEFVSLRDICCQDHANEAMKHVGAGSMHIHHQNPSTSLDMLRLACTGALGNKHTHVRHHLSTLQQKSHSHEQGKSGSNSHSMHPKPHLALTRPPKRHLSNCTRRRDPSKATGKRTKMSQTPESTPPLVVQIPDQAVSKLPSCYNVVTPLSESDRHEALTCKWIVSGCAEDSAQSVVCGHVFNSAQELQLHVESEHIDAMMQRKADERRLTQQNRRRSGSTASTDTTSTEATVNAPLFCMWQGCSRCGVGTSTSTDDMSTTGSSTQGNGFAVKGKLQIHVRTHTGHKPYACTHPGCSSRFKTADALCKHVRTHTGEKPYACPEPGCGRAFATPTELRTHETVHTGARPHRCNVCGQRFADASNLSKHRKTHREKGNICLQCGTRFTRADQLERHCLKMGHCLDILKRRDGVGSRRASTQSVTISPSREQTIVEVGAVLDGT